VLQCIAAAEVYWIIFFQHYLTFSCTPNHPPFFKGGERVPRSYGCVGPT